MNKPALVAKHVRKYVSREDDARRIVDDIRQMFGLTQDNVTAVVNEIWDIAYNKGKQDGQSAELHKHGEPDY